MTQRLVDIVEHQDAEHDTFELEMESASVMGSFFSTEPRQVMEDPSAPYFELYMFGGLEMVQFDVRPNQRQGMEFLDSVQPEELGLGFSFFLYHSRPSTAVEDISIIETVPGI